MTRLLLVTAGELGLTGTPSDPRVMRALGSPVDPWEEEFGGAVGESRRARGTSDLDLDSSIRGVRVSAEMHLASLPPTWSGRWDPGLAELEQDPGRDPTPWLRGTLDGGSTDAGVPKRAPEGSSVGGPWLLVVSKSLKWAWLHRALGLGHRAGVGPRVAGLLALEWPRNGGSGPARGLRLGGLDLDRIPTSSAGGREPFPGAPGSAPTRA